MQKFVNYYTRIKMLEIEVTSKHVLKRYEKRERTHTYLSCITGKKHKLIRDLRNGTYLLRVVL